MRICISGAGEISLVHVKGINQIQNAEVVGICDKYLTRAEMLGENCGNPKPFNDFEKMLDEQKPAVLHICTPPLLHYEQAKIAIDRGVNVIVEKPFTTNEKEARELYALAKENGVKICPMYNLLYDKAMSEISAIIKAGEIGNIVNVESYYGFNLGGDRSKYNLKGSTHWVFKTPGGHLQNIGPHILSSMLAIIGTDNLTYNSIAVNSGSAPEGLYDEYRSVVVNGNITGYFTLSLNAQPYFNYINIYGTKKTVLYDISNWSYVVQSLSQKVPNAIARAWNNIRTGTKIVGATLISCPLFLTGKLTHFTGMWELIRLFYECVENDTPPPISEELSISTVAGLETIDRQTRQLSENRL